MVRIAFAATLLFCAVNAAAVEPVTATADRATMQAQAGQLFSARRWKEFEAAALQHADPKALSEDGVPLSFLYWSGLQSWMQDREVDEISDMVNGSIEYRKTMPDSAIAVLAEVSRIHRIAWMLRGGGYANTVSDAGWKLFRQYNGEAWKLLEDSKTRTAQFPYWYLEAIAVGMDADIPDEQLRKILKEGLRKFPGNFSLYFRYLRTFAQRWGGDYESMDQFIREAAADAPQGQHDVYYARLYWSMFQHENQDPAFFDQSLVDWPRMRRGLELVMKQLPNSTWNRASLVMFACLNRDVSAYNTWRSGVSQAGFTEVAPQGVTMKACDKALRRIA
jgi:hypothetical protein